MLLKHAELEAIRSGCMTLVIRRWRRPNVQTGGTLLTPVGVLAIERVSQVRGRDITDNDARAAGYGSRLELLNQLETREGDIYRVEVRFAGVDPRVQLRDDSELSDADLKQLTAKLGRLDAASRVGDWTRKVLSAIQSHPQVAAADLAHQTGFEKDWLKTNIRKLKNLGLTISLHPGYELSPRGAMLLRLLRPTARNKGTE